MLRLTVVRSSFVGRAMLVAVPVFTLSAGSAAAQTLQPRPPAVFTPAPQPQRIVPPRPKGTISLSGPRFGMTMLSQAHLDALADRGIHLVRPMVTQFGWQFEKRLYTSDDGVTALTEFVPLLSGLEQGVALPSLNWLIGIRTPTGSEFGIGPNITPLGTGLVIAAGVTVRSGALNVPLNFAVAMSKSGTRVSVMTGFNIRQ